MFTTLLQNILGFHPKHSGTLPVSPGTNALINPTQIPPANCFEDFLNARLLHSTQTTKNTQTNTGQIPIFFPPEFVEQLQNGALWGEPGNPKGIPNITVGFPKQGKMVFQKYRVRIKPLSDQLLPDQNGFSGEAPSVPETGKTPAAESALLMFVPLTTEQRGSQTLSLQIIPEAGVKTLPAADGFPAKLTLLVKDEKTDTLRKFELTIERTPGQASSNFTLLAGESAVVQNLSTFPAGSELLARNQAENAMPNDATGTNAALFPGAVTDPVGGNPVPKPAGTFGAGKPADALPAETAAHRTATFTPGQPTATSLPGSPEPPFKTSGKQTSHQKAEAPLPAGKPIQAEGVKSVQNPGQNSAAIKPAVKIPGNENVAVVPSEPAMIFSEKLADNTFNARPTVLVGKNNLLSNPENPTPLDPEIAVKNPPVSGNNAKAKPAVPQIRNDFEANQTTTVPTGADGAQSNSTPWQTTLPDRALSIPNQTNFDSRMQNRLSGEINKFTGKQFSKFEVATSVSPRVNTGIFQRQKLTDDSPNIKVTNVADKPAEAAPRTGTNTIEPPGLPGDASPTEGANAPGKPNKTAPVKKNFVGEKRVLRERPAEAAAQKTGFPRETFSAPENRPVPEQFAVKRQPVPLKKTRPVLVPPPELIYTEKPGASGQGQMAVPPEIISPPLTETSVTAPAQKRSTETVRLLQKIFHLNTGETGQHFSPQLPPVLRQMIRQMDSGTPVKTVTITPGGFSEEETTDTIRKESKPHHTAPNETGKASLSKNSPAQFPVSGKHTFQMSVAGKTDLTGFGENSQLPEIPPEDKSRTTVQPEPVSKKESRTTGNGGKAETSAEEKPALSQTGSTFNREAVEVSPALTASGKKISPAVSGKSHSASGTAAAYQPAEFVQSLSAELWAAVQNNRREILIQLQPENLGLVRIRLKMEKDRLSGKIAVNSPEVHQLLVKNAQQLSQRLQDLNIRFDSLNFDLFDTNSGSRKQGGAQQAKGHLHAHALSDNQEMPQENEQNIYHRLMFDNSTFEYIA